MKLSQIELNRIESSKVGTKEEEASSMGSKWSQATFDEREHFMAIPRVI